MRVVTEYSPYIVSQPGGLNGPVKLIDEYIDPLSFETVKGWIRFCQGQPTKVCSTAKDFLMSVFKLIDCETESIVPSGGLSYLALSYV
jgi:hypothetical protein